MRAITEESTPSLGAESNSSTDRIITADDLLDIAARGHRRYELIRGRLHILPFNDPAHGQLAAGVGTAIYLFAVGHNLGKVFSAGTGFIVEQNPDTVRSPDTGFVRADRLTGPLTDKYFPGAPDLAVEVVSPTDRADEVQDKVQDWLSHGTQLVWVVEPKTRTVTVYRPDGTANVLQADDTLDGEAVLPGFRFSLERLWG